MLLLAAGCAGWLGSPSSLADRPGAGGGVVREFCRRFGTRGYRQIAGLFREDAVFEIEGLGIALHGHAGITELAEYGAAVGSRFSVAEIAEAGDTVVCVLEETNDWYRLLGVNHVVYEVRFAVRRGRIERASARMARSSREALGQKLAEFAVWLAGNEPASVEKLMPGGRLRLNKETGTQMLQLMRRWRL